MLYKFGVPTPQIDSLAKDQTQSSSFQAAPATRGSSGSTARTTHWQMVVRIECPVFKFQIPLQFPNVDAFP